MAKDNLHVPWLIIILLVGSWQICSRSSVPGKALLRMTLGFVGVFVFFLLLALLMPSKAEAFGTVAAVGGVFAAIDVGVNHLVTVRKTSPITPGKVPKM